MIKTLNPLTFAIMMIEILLSKEIMRKLTVMCSLKRMVIGQSCKPSSVEVKVECRKHVQERSLSGFFFVSMSTLALAFLFVRWNNY